MTDPTHRLVRPMKVAVHVEGAAIRGNERQTLLVVGELMKRGHTVVASCRAESDVDRAFRGLGVRTTGARPSGDADLWNALRFAAWLRRERPDAALLTSWKRAFVAGWAARVARVPRVVLRVGGTHGVARDLRGWKHRHALTRWSDAVVANSRNVARKLFERVPGLAPERVYLVPNGVSLAPADPAPLRRELNLSPDALILAGVGGLDWIKGYDLLLYAVAALADPALHVVVAGEGNERERLTERAERLGLGGRLHLLGHRGDVAAVLAASDVFVLSSRTEGMSVAMMEAMLARRPVVAADVGGVYEGVAARAGRPPAGWVVPPDDAPALAAALREVVAALRGDPDAVRARVEEALWRLDHWFTVERMVRGVEAALLGLPRGEWATEAWDV